MHTPSHTIHNPPHKTSSHRQLQETYGLSSNRDMPEWGARIFSPLCVLVRPTAPDDMTKFIRYAIAVARVHLELSLLATPVPSNEYVCVCGGWGVWGLGVVVGMMVVVMVLMGCCVCSSCTPYHVHTHPIMHTHIHCCMHTHTNTHTHTHTHTHTQTHTHMSFCVHTTPTLSLTCHPSPPHTHQGSAFEAHSRGTCTFL